MRNYFIINGKNSLDLQGFAVNELPPISKPAKRTLIETIDGRDGDIVTDLGYSAYDKSATVGVYGTYDINEIISFFDSEGTIVFSDELDKYYKFKIINQIDFNELVKFRTAKVVFHCQPFKYALDEEPITKEAEVLTASGSNITLNGTVENHRMSIEPLGKSSQESTSGKQLLDLQDNTRTVDGVTVTISKGHVSIKGTNTNMSPHNIINQNTNLPTFEAGETYTLSKYKTTGNVYSQFVYSNGTINQALGYVGPEAKVTFTVPNDFVSLTAFQIYMNSNTTNVDLEFDIMLAKGSYTSDTMPEFEVFSGGQQAPNPDFPYPIKDVTGDNEVEVVNKNLLVPEILTNNYSYTYNSSTGYYSGSAGNYNETTILNLKTPEYITFNYDGDAVHSIFFNISYEDGTSGVYYPWSSNTFSTNKKVSKVTSAIADRNLTTSFKMMINYGQSAFPIENNKSQSHLLSLGVENLIDSSDLIGTIASSARKDITTFNFDKAGDYYLTTNVQVSLVFRNSSDTNILSVSSGNFTVGTTKVTKFTLTDEIINSLSKISVYPYGDAYLNIVEWKNLMITETSSLNSYSPYGQEPIHLRGIGDYRDSIVGSPDNWKIKRKIGDVVLDENTTGINKADNTSYSNDYLRFQKMLSDKKPNDGVDTKLDMILCNNFTCKILNQSETRTSNSIAGAGSNGNINIFIDKTIIGGTELSNFTTWLSTHNTEIQYVLANPTYETITNETLINQLNELYYAYSYEGQTNVFVTSGGEQMEVNLSVLGDDSLTVTNEGNIYSKPTFSVYGEGSIGVYLNDMQVFTIDLGEEEYITIDIANMEAYKDGILKNRLVTGNYNNFKLNVGENKISFSGVVTKFEISNYSRWL